MSMAQHNPLGRMSRRGGPPRDLSTGDAAVASATAAGLSELTAHRARCAVALQTQRPNGLTGDEALEILEMLGLLDGATKDSSP